MAGRGRRGWPGTMRAGKWQWGSGQYRVEIVFQAGRGERGWLGVKIRRGRKETTTGKW